MFVKDLKIIVDKLMSEGKENYDVCTVYHYFKNEVVVHETSQEIELIFE